MAYEPLVKQHVLYEAGGTMSNSLPHLSRTRGGMAQSARSDPEGSRYSRTAPAPGITFD